MTWCRTKRNLLTGNDHANVLNMLKQNQRAASETRKEVLKIYADMIIYAIGPARLVATMCHHKLPTTSVTLLTLSNY